MYGVGAVVVEVVRWFRTGTGGVDKTTRHVRMNTHTRGLPTSLGRCEGPNPPSTYTELTKPHAAAPVMGLAGAGREARPSHVMMLAGLASIVAVSPSSDVSMIPRPATISRRPQRLGLRGRQPYATAGAVQGWSCCGRLSSAIDPIMARARRHHRRHRRQHLLGSGSPTRYSQSHFCGGSTASHGGRLLTHRE